MTFGRRRDRSRPELPGDEYARLAKFAKPQHQPEPERTDTTELQHRKLHPLRDKGFRKWLRPKRCAIFGLLDHRCWNDNDQGLNDAAHTTKAGLALKGPDSGCISLCRLAHKEQERDMDAFDAKYGINRHELAADYWLQYQRERGTE